MNNRIRRLCLFVLFGMIFLHASLLRAEELVVVATPSSAFNSLSKAQVADIFLGRVVVAPWGRRITIFDLEAPAGVKGEFYEKVLAKSLTEVRALWARLYFTGRGMPPEALGSSAEIKTRLAGNDNAIAYLPKSEADGSVKVLYSVK